MKPRINFVSFLALLLAFAINGAAQGQFVFNNSGSTAITNPYTGARATGLTVAMYFSTNTNATHWNNMMMLNTNAVTNLISPGIFIGGTRTVPGVPGGTTISMEVRAWPTNYPTWEAADVGWNCGSALLGYSAPITFALGTNGGPTPTLNGNGFFPFLMYGNTGPTRCGPYKLTAIPNPNPTSFQLRIDAGPDYVAGGAGSTHIQIQGSTTLESNSWQVLFNSYVYFPYFWADPRTNTQRFYRVRPLD